MTDGAVTNVRDISTLSFRIARDLPHCADPLLHKLDPLCGVLICGSPGSGKTTLIRDMARSLSYRYRVSLLDERGELGAYYHGRSGFSLGLCDTYIGYPKNIAAQCAVRSMSPDIIVCDELGDKNDVEILMNSLRCGTAFIATVHAGSMEDLRQRKITSELIGTGAFRYIVFLGAGNEVGKVQKIYEMSDSYA
jgi:stage III sporulation protein AA